VNPRNLGAYLSFDTCCRSLQLVTKTKNVRNPGCAWIEWATEPDNWVMRISVDFTTSIITADHDL
jgi:hypothetical protein